MNSKNVEYEWPDEDDQEMENSYQHNDYNEQSYDYA